MEKLTAKENKDRLDLVRIMDTSIVAIQRSIVGWMHWIRNPSTMATFSLDELRAMSENLSKFAIEFTKYDAEITEKMGKKIPKRIPEEAIRRERMGYVA